MSIQALHERAVKVAKDYLRCEAELLEIFQELDRSKGFRMLGYASLFDYARSLGLSEGTAYSLIAVARKSVTVPALKESVAQGAVTLSNARRIAPILTPANQDAWLAKARELPKAALERELAREFPKEAQPDRVKPLNAERAALSLSLSNSLLEKIRRIQDLESSRLSKAVSLEEALEAMAEAFLERRDPVRKAERAASKPERANPPELGPGQVVGARRPIPAATRHQVTLRDQDRCTAQTPHGRCEARRWLQVHHVTPVSKGGANTPDNLTTLCATHHQMHHEKVG